MDAVYTTEALSTGAGRDGRAVVKDSDLVFTMTAPKEMGGSGEGATQSSFSLPVTQPATTPRSRQWPRTRA